MKKVLFAISALVLSNLCASAQSVQGTIVSPAANKIAVYAKTSGVGLTNVLFLNINITISIPDQTASGGTNPTGAEVQALSDIPNLGIAEAVSPAFPANPYVANGRAYYSYILNDNNATTTTTWPANTPNNPVAEFTFPSNSYIPGAQLDDLSGEGGPNGQMFWYVSIIGGVGDVTDYTTMFYSVPEIPATNNGGASPSFVPLQPLTVLPVNFLSFTATKKNNSALLNWSVESEDANTVSYQIETSVNGVDFTPFKTIPALNNGRSNNVYNFTVDNLSAIRSMGAIYFRIKQTDRDGKFVYSPIRSVRLEGKGLLVGVYPNPVKNTANVTIDLDANAAVSISILDASGKQLSIQQLQGIKGANITKVDMSRLATGSYSLKVQTTTEVKVVPVVKAVN